MKNRGQIRREILRADRDDFSGHNGVGVDAGEKLLAATREYVEPLGEKIRHSAARIDAGAFAFSPTK